MSNQFKDRYTIVIDGDNKQLELSAIQTVNQLKKVTGAANDANGATGRLGKSVKTTSNNTAAFAGPLGGISSRLGALTGLLGSTSAAMVGVGLSAAGMGTMIIGAIREFDQLELRTRKTEALLKATGNASGLTSDQLDAMARSVALNTLASVEGIKDAQNVLLRFRAVSGDIFTDAISLSQDLAAVVGGDAVSAAQKLGQALENPAKELESLKDAGVSFSDAEKKLVADMVEAGREADAQRLILERLRMSIGGAGAAEASGTLSGSLDTLSQRWQELKLSIVDASAAGTLSRDFLDVMARGLQRVNEEFFPEDEDRFAELVQRRADLQQQLEKLASGQRTGALSWIVGTKSELLNVNRELDEVTAELKQIQDRRKAQQTAETEAQAAAAAAEQRRLEERKAALEKAQQEELEKLFAKNAQALDAMDMRFADEQTRLDLNLDTTLAKIETYQISEEELRRRGFENIQEMRRYYAELAYEEYNAGHMALMEKRTSSAAEEIAEEERKQAQLQRIQQQSAANTLAARARLETSLFSLAKTAAGKNKTLQYSLLALETSLNAARAIQSGYTGGMIAAEALAWNPPAAAAAKAEFVRSGYISAAAIVANGVGQAMSMGGGSGGSSGGSSFDSTGTTLSNNDYAANQQMIYEQAAADRRQQQQGIVIQGDYYSQGAVQAMDSESFADFARRNRSAIASATEEELNEYGQSLVRA